MRNDKPFSIDLGIVGLNGDSWFDQVVTPVFQSLAELRFIQTNGFAFVTDAKDDSAALGVGECDDRCQNIVLVILGRVGLEFQVLSFSQVKERTGFVRSVLDN